MRLFNNCLSLDLVIFLGVFMTTPCLQAEDYFVEEIVEEIATCKIVKVNNLNGKAATQVTDVALQLRHENWDGLAAVGLTGKITDSLHGEHGFAVSGYLGKRGEYQLGEAVENDQTIQIKEKSENVSISGRSVTQIAIEFDKKLKTLTFESKTIYYDSLFGLFPRRTFRHWSAVAQCE